MEMYTRARARIRNTRINVHVRAYPHTFASQIKRVSLVSAGRDYSLIKEQGGKME